MTKLKLLNKIIKFQQLKQIFQSHSFSFHILNRILNIVPFGLLFHFHWLNFVVNFQLNFIELNVSSQFLLHFGNFVEMQNQLTQNKFVKKRKYEYESFEPK